ncbi:1-deoxy-D-xylulose-5-phosphate reductoisomerase [Phycisphaerales bacterium AB-hyl4]|uniref:1-deoxy-D-xylulose 5-phosphate reductoisomerase n=1 Tax=Natronomicrosphaera hydrolytica TaxID=3242702 RepID=A0ABV4U1A2_9BACT
MSDADARKLIVLGSTGSIGVNTLNVVEHLRRTRAATIEVVGLAASRSSTKLIEQAKQHHVRHIAVADPAIADEVRAALPDAKVYVGDAAAETLVREVEATDVAAAVVGSAGLPATLAAVQLGRRVSLANKETLVAAGMLVTPLVREHGAQLLPVDSEHSAIFQCLAEHPRREVKRIVLTASGGPFRTADKTTIENATVEQALKHPTWTMGRKITIDSATMMNKALEIIEAHWLFGLAGEKIDVIVHPQSIVHSFVEFVDHNVLAQLGSPDMRGPIQYALTWPDRPVGCSEAMDWSALSQLTFEPPDLERFPALKLAYDVIDAGGTAGAVFNAANEAAVQAFLERQVRFGRIVELVTEALAAIEPEPVESLETILDADRKARAFVAQRIRTTPSAVS